MVRLVNDIFTILIGPTVLAAAVQASEGSANLEW